MSEDKKEKKKLSLSGKETLRLRKKAVDSGQVRQSLGRGRSKTVVVEHRRRRGALKEDEPLEQSPEENEEPALKESEKEPEPSDNDEEGQRSRVVLKTLTEEEKASRARALKAAEEAQEARQKAMDEERRRQEEREKVAAEQVEAERRRVEEAERKAKEKEARERAEQEVARRFEPEAEEQEEAKKSAKARKGKPEKPKGEPGKRSEPRRRERKLTIQDAYDMDEERQRSLASIRRKREREKKAQQEAAASDTPQRVIRDVTIPDAITVQELSNRMAEKAPAVIKTLMKLGVMATINQVIDGDTAELVVEEFGHRVKRVSESDVEEGLIGKDDAPEDLTPRAPVVTVMGHVDHGKTSLLDAMRETDVAAGEAGGITQHIGAYQVTVSGDGKITFIDTPGHEAFTSMRARGANITDIVVLVVAADDGIMPQTVEAINHAKAAEVPIVVAINKMDTPGADADRVRQDLLQHEVIVESMGGEVLDAEVSAIKKEGLDKLEEMILLQAELLELKANPKRRAEGTIVEAKLEKGRGPVATVLVQRGTLHVGDVAVAGIEWGRVRALIDDHGNQLDEAGPSQPAEILGLGGVPQAGDLFSVVDDESRAREVTEFRERQLKEKTSVAGAPVTLETMFSNVGEDKAEELAIVVKADTQGSAEAVISALENLSTDEVAVHVIHSGVGGISESDVKLANSSGAIIVGFNVRATRQARAQAEQDGVELRYYSIIYDLVDDLKKALSGLLEPTRKENEIGRADVLQVFSVSGYGKAAGCLVTEGVVRRGAKVRLLRDDVVVYEGELSSLRRVKDEVKEVQAGTECGMAFAKFDDIKEGDIVEVFEVEEIERSL